MSLTFALWGCGLLALRQGDLPRALPLLERAVGICQDADLLGYFPWMAWALGAAYTLAERVADAVSLLTQAMEPTTASDMAGYQALCRLPLGEAHLLAARLEDAHTLADMVRTDSHQLRPVAGDSDQAEAVKVVARAHKTLIWERTRHAHGYVTRCGSSSPRRCRPSMI